MMKKFLILLLCLITIIFGSSSILGADERLQKESEGLPSVTNGFDIERGNQTDLNNWVAKNGAEVYQHLNNYPKIGYPQQSRNLQFSTESEHWIVYCPFGDSQVDFIKKKDVPASKAIRSLLTSGGQFDCRIAQRIVFLECMRRLLGDIVFDELTIKFEAELSLNEFAKKGETRRLHLCGSKVLNPFIRLTTQENDSLYKCGITGHFGYIPNIEDYATLHPFGFLRGDHGLISSEEQENPEDTLYIGFGSFYKEGGIRWVDVVSRFKKETLTLSSFESSTASENQVPSSRRAIYEETIKELRASEVQEKMNIIENLQFTYEERLKCRQIDFREFSASYFINVVNLKSLLK